MHSFCQGANPCNEQPQCCSTRLVSSKVTGFTPTWPVWTAAQGKTVKHPAAYILLILLLSSWSRDSRSAFRWSASRSPSDTRQRAPRE